MEQFSKFIVENWSYISIGFIALFELILFLFKKRSKTEIVDASAYSDILTWILEAEKKFGSGEGIAKFQYVLDMYVKSRGLDEEHAKYVVDFVVDRIMDAPTQKGGFGREDE